METVLDRNVKRGCLITVNDRGLYDLAVIENGMTVETVRHVKLECATRIAEDKLRAEKPKT